MTKRIALIGPASGELGGMEMYMLRVAAAVAATPDLDIELCFKRTARFDPRPEFTRALTEVTVPVTLVDRASPGLVQTVRRADLVHLQNYSPDVAALTQALRTPLLVTVHGHRAARPPARSRVGELMARGAVARWYNSDFTWSTWEPAGRRASSRRVSLRPDAPLPARPTASRLGFVFAARWVANKGLETLVEAYAAADLDRARWPLVLLGDGPLRTAVIDLLRDRGIVAQTPGYVSEAERWEALSRAKWLVAPPHTGEDLGLTPLEARSVGVPCIVSRDGGLPEAAGCASLMCTPGDVAELTGLLELAAHMSEQEYERWVDASTRSLDATQPALSVEHPRLYRELFSPS